MTTMFRSFPVGTLLGFPVRVNLSFLLLLLVVFVWMGGMQGLAVALMAAFSVLLHELGHALAARRLGVRVAGIELHFFGGAAQIGMPRTPRDEIVISAAGPAVSLGLGAIGLLLAAVTSAQALVLFGWVNVGLAVFNLLPAFPSDGGRILRALLARRRGLVAATDTAVKVGRVICVALGLGGLFLGSVQLVLVAVVLWMMGSAERAQAHLRGDSGAWRSEQARLITDVEYIPPGAAYPARAPIMPRVAPRIVIWRL